MADISFTVDGTTFTFAEGEVKQIQSSIETDAQQERLSSSPAMSAQLFDFSGVLKTIRLSGVLFETTASRISGYSINTIVEQKQWLESLLNGTQDSIEFSSNYESLTPLQKSGATAPYKSAFTSTKCIIANLNFSEIEGKTSELAFNITLYVGIKA